MNGRQQLISAEIPPGPTPVVKQRQVLFSASPYDLSQTFQSYDVSPDDKRFIMVRTLAASETDLVLTENWFQELRARTGK